MSTPRTAIEAVDPELARAIADEERRQRGKIELIASENYASAAVLAAQGSVLTNKYAEGYPGKRYYGGCEYVDVAESLAIARAKALFGAAHANVQPHSGSSANLTAYFSLIEPGDTVMGMSLAQGGHLTHGSPVNFSGKFFHFVAYGVDRESERIDMDEVARLAREHRPKLIIGGATAYSRLWDFARFRQIADEVGAIFLVDMAHFAGLVAGGVHPNPVPHAQVVTSTTHKTLRGPRGGFILTNDAELGQKIDKSNFPGFQGGPLMHVIAAKAVAFHEAQQPAFRDYARRVVQNARALAEGLQAEGLRIVSGGTDNHLLLLDLTSAELSGKAAEKALDAVGITTNKNTIPFDQRSPMVTSGLRLGSPAVTTRGFGPDELRRVARWIAQVLAHRDEPAVTRQVADEVAALTGRFPVPGIADS